MICSVDHTFADFNLLSFWKWAASDLVDNTWRGVPAEYLVAKARNQKMMSAILGTSGT